jgi:hypothetical protein
MRLASTSALLLVTGCLAERFVAPVATTASPDPSRIEIHEVRPLTGTVGWVVDRRAYRWPGDSARLSRLLDSGCYQSEPRDADARLLTLDLSLSSLTSASSITAADLITGERENGSSELSYEWASPDRQHNAGKQWLVAECNFWQQFAESRDPHFGGWNAHRVCERASRATALEARHRSGCDHNDSGGDLSIFVASSNLRFRRPRR